MSYIGNPPAEAYTNTVKDSFSGDGSTTAFTLSRPSLTNDVRVVVENVIQDPTVAYSVSGTTLTFTSAPPSGTNNIYVVHLGPAVQTTVPPDGVTVTDLNAYGDGAAAFTANRASSDGTIIDLQKNGSSVGSIGTLTSVGVALQVKGAVNSQPVDIITKNSGGSDITYRFHDSLGVYAPDATQNLGRSTARWKDLYLSGGVYLGGTGAANYLDDYEEGVWTPVILGSVSNPTVNYSLRTAYYTKIGRQVTVSGIILLSSLSGGSGQALVGGLPFTVSNSTQAYFVGTLGQMEDFTTTGGNTDGQNLCIRADQGTTNLRFLEGSETNTYDWQVSNLTATFLCRFNVTYFVD